MKRINTNIPYSIFSGVLAYPTWLWLASAVTQQPSQARTSIAIAVAALTLLAAAIGSHLARAVGKSDHGSIAAVFTSIGIAVIVGTGFLIALLFTLFVTIGYAFTMPTDGLLAGTIVWSSLSGVAVMSLLAFLAALPFCLVASLLFTILHRIRQNFVPNQKQP